MIHVSERSERTIGRRRDRHAERGDRAKASARGASGAAVSDRLAEYRRKRDAGRTPEPVPAGPAAAAATTTRSSSSSTTPAGCTGTCGWSATGCWCRGRCRVGIPRDPARNHLAVHTEDHPLEYADFHGEIPSGEYGGGRMTIFDRGTYATEKWRDREVIVVLEGDPGARPVRAFPAPTARTG